MSKEKSMMLRNGEILDLDRPKPEVFDADTIAIALSRCCRWNNQTTIFYSVAQHSIMVKDAVQFAGGDKLDQMVALLHDAGEGFINDGSRPLKKKIPQLVEVEDSILDAIMKQFLDIGLNDIPRSTWNLVKMADEQILMLESTVLFPRQYCPIDTSGLVEPFKNWGNMIIECDFIHAKKQFVSNFYLLQNHALKIAAKIHTRKK